MEPIYRAIAKAVRESKRFSLNENSALIDLGPGVNSEILLVMGGVWKEFVEVLFQVVSECSNL